MQALLNPTAYAQRLAQACDTLRLDASEKQIGQLQQYIEQLLRWNRSYNLTAIRKPDQMLTQHILDCLAVVGPVQHALAVRENQGPTILDVGSGAGLPGVVLAIMLPAVHVTCVDAVEKKMTFVRQMRGVLELSNLSATHARVETQSAQYDVVISRAFASLSDFAQTAGERVLPTGNLIAMKARPTDDEFAELAIKTTWSIERVEPIHVPELQAQRCLVWLHRTGNP
jgi:16S rRNA (guanine527-N7)-methyltransferase